MKSELEEEKVQAKRGRKPKMVEPKEIKNLTVGENLEVEEPIIQDLDVIGNEIVEHSESTNSKFIAAIKKFKYTKAPKAIRDLPPCKPVRDSKTNPKIGRNEPCPCESGKKFKHCCIDK